MFKEKAINFFGGESVIAIAAGITRQAVNQWGDVVPETSAPKLEKASKGKLKYDPEFYEKLKRNAA